MWSITGISLLGLQGGTRRSRSGCTGVGLVTRPRVIRVALFSGVLLSVVVLGSVFGARSEATSVPGAHYRDDIVLVRFANTTPPSDRHAAQDQVGGLGMRRIGRETVALRVPAGEVQTVVTKLEARRDVVYAEPDYLHTQSAVPSDSSFGLQWALRNTGQSVNDKAGVAGADEHVTAAWNLTTGTPSVVVAEVDSGVDYTHPDLGANIWSNPGGLGGCAAGTHGFNVLTGTCDPMDDETVFGGHGTHVAGIIGAIGNNATGVAGVNWTTSILPVKWLDSSGFGSTSDLISALDWLLKMKQAGVNIRVVNDSATFVGTSPSQALSDEIDLLGQNDILFVTAAGNTGDDNDDPAKQRYPCGYARPTEICVTASDQTDHLPTWANHGADTVDLAAPGDNIYSTLRNGTYGYISGGSTASASGCGRRGTGPVARLHVRRRSASRHPEQRRPARAAPWLRQDRRPSRCLQGRARVHRDGHTEDVRNENRRRPPRSTELEPEARQPLPTLHAEQGDEALRVPAKQLRDREAGAQRHHLFRRPECPENPSRRHEQNLVPRRGGRRLVRSLVSEPGDASTRLLLDRRHQRSDLEDRRSTLEECCVEREAQREPIRIGPEQSVRLGYHGRRAAVSLRDLHIGW